LDSADRYPVLPESSMVAKTSIVLCIAQLDEGYAGIKMIPHDVQKAEGKMGTKPQPSWRDLYQTYQDGQYYLFDSSTGQPTAAAISPSPFFKPGVEPLLQEFEKPPAERNPSAIAAGTAMLGQEMLEAIARLPDDASRLELLAAYDPRFGRVPEDIARDLLANLVAAAARRSTADGRRRAPGGRRSRRGEKFVRYFESHPDEARTVCGARGRRGAALIRKVIESAGVRVFGDKRDKPVLAMCRRAAAAAVKKSCV
jgi:hypothetical protein